MKHNLLTRQRILEVTLLVTALLCATNAIITRSHNEAERDELFHRIGIANKQWTCVNDYVKYSHHTATDRIEMQLCKVGAEQ